MTGVSAGGALRLPLFLVNHAVSAKPTLVGSPPIDGQPVFVRSVWVREGRGEWQQQELPWERLEAGPNNGKPIDIIVDNLDSVGTHLVQVAIVLQSRPDYRSATFAFSTALDVTVREDKELTIQQNINYSADVAQSGATIYAPFRVSGQDTDGGNTGTNADREQTLVHASMFEREKGIRGMQDGTAVKCSANFSWHGFQQLNTPESGPIVSPNGVLVFGRDRTRRQPDREGEAPNSNDVRLLVYQRDGQVNENAAMAISRKHFGVFIEDDRLRMRVLSEGGATCDGKRMKKGDIVTLKSGSRISPFVTPVGKLEIEIGFEIEHGEVVTVNAKRLPSRSS